VPVRDGHLGAVAFRHLGRVGLRPGAGNRGTRRSARRDSANAEREPANASENNALDTSVSANAEPAADPIAEASARRGAALPKVIGGPL
jgi:hypothetical protein